MVCGGGGGEGDCVEGCWVGGLGVLVAATGTAVYFSGLRVEKGS